MTNSRKQLAATRLLAGKAAALLAAKCFDRAGTEPVIEARAVAALSRAFKRMLLANGPVVLPISDQEAAAFPGYSRNLRPGSVTWLAAGLAAEGCALYALQTAIAPNRNDAHELARAGALDLLTAHLQPRPAPDFRFQNPDQFRASAPGAKGKEAHK